MNKTAALQTFLVGRFEDKLLDSPVQDFSYIEFVFGRAGDFVNPAELARLLAGLAEHAEKFAVKAELVDATGKASDVKRTWLGGGVMQMVQGAPGDIVPVFCVGRLPMADVRWGRAERRW